MRGGCIGAGVDNENVDAVRDHAADGMDPFDRHDGEALRRRSTQPSMNRQAVTKAKASATAAVSRVFSLESERPGWALLLGSEPWATEDRNFI